MPHFGKRIANCTSTSGIPETEIKTRFTRFYFALPSICIIFASTNIEIVCVE